MRTKDEILVQYASIDNILQSLLNLNDQIWFIPIQLDKWSTSEIVAHILFWDRFILERLLLLQSQKCLTKANINVDAFNRKSANYAKSGVVKDELIQQFKEARFNLIHFLEAFSEEDFSKIYMIQDKNQSLQDYMNAMVDHDNFHFNQITTFLIEKGHY
ncbi:DinB family protein [Bacillus pfraonensis]|uniref:DinB family protein n=1 Tax=Bacillus TaxID=1386 RepID=UPI002A50DB48|nr:DinB family protein [Bacillus pseudomycoides]